MPDFGSPVAQNVNVNPNQGIQTLSGLLSLQQQQLGIQTSQQQLQQQQVQTLMVQRQQQARTFLTGMMQSKKDEQGNSILDATGEPDPAKVTAAVARNIPTDLAQPIIQSVLKSETDKVGLEASASSLDTQQRAMLMGPVQAAALNPNAKSGDINAGIDNLVSAHPEMSNAAGYLKGLVAHLDNVPPDKRASAIQTIAAHMQGGTGVQTQPTPANVVSGKTQFQGTVAPPVAGGGFTPGTAGPTGAAPSYIYDPVSKTYYAAPGTGGTAPAPVGAPPQPTPGTAPAPARTAAPSAGAPGLPHYTPGESETLAESTAQVSAARKAGDQVGVNRDINQRILALNKQTATGPGTDFVHQAAAAAGLPAGSSYQELGAFLDRQAAMASQSMGLPETNMGIETAKQFTGNTKYNNQVIADKTKFVDALNTAAGAYRAGVDRVVGTGSNPNMGAFPQFRATWAKNFDPEVFAYENAVKTGDVEEQRSIEQAEGQKGMAQLLKKRVALMGLVNGSAGQ